MNALSLRSSRSSYRDHRYISSSSVEPVSQPGPPPSKVLVDGYRGMLGSIEDEEPQYNPLNSSQSRHSNMFDSSDPIVMHLLAETALSDSASLQVLPFEEVEEVKRELSLLTNRIDASKRKLTLELKLHEAAQSLGRLDGPGAGQDPDGSELAISTKKCEDLAQDLWKLERRASELRSKLLEHTAGVLQMTHKGLKKKSSTKDPSAVNGDGGDYFDDRSLYKSADYVEVDTRATQTTATKLEELNQRMRDMLLKARPNEDFDPIPQQVANGAPASSSAAVQDHLAYLERGLESMASHQDSAPAASDSTTEQRLEEFNKQLDDILVDMGARQKFSPHNSTLRKDVPQQISALEEAMLDVQKRVRGLSDQKDILTTQIQQQRELNTKSDAERDSRIGELQKELEDARQEVATAKDGPEQNDVLEEKDAEIDRLRSEHAELESEMVGIRTELTMVKAELDGAHGSKRERGAEALQKEVDELSERNLSLTEELASLKAEQSNKGNSDLQQRVQMLETELRETIDDYEALTKSSIEFEKERDNLESMIDKYRDRCEDLEAQLNDEKIQGLGSRSTSGAREAPPTENTSTSVLKKEFKKMMRDTRAENMKALKAEQEERRKLEALVRTLKKEQAESKPSLSQSTVASSS